MSSSAGTPRIAIVGGGFTGAAVATHLALKAPAPLTIEVIEPRALLGGGVAYSSLDPAHRTNVAAARMSLFTDDESHFSRWLVETGALADDPGSVLADGRVYPRRRVFGRYVADQLERAARIGRATIHHVRERALEVAADPLGWSIVLASGRTIRADLVVLAVSHPPPSVPHALADVLGEHAGFVPNPWAPDALKTIMPMDTVMIMGTALSMADVVASLELQGHRGQIVAFSRRGLLSRAHADRHYPPFGEFTGAGSTTALEMLLRVRRTVGDAARLGVPWQSVIDAMRRDGQEVWRSLAPRERSRFLRHLRPYWEVHRYRVAPQIGAVIERRLTNGSLEVVTGSLERIEVDGGVIRTALTQRRHRAERARRVVESEAFVLTTGPAHAAVIDTNPALGSLARTGHLQQDAFGLGVLVDRHHRSITTSGLPQPSLLVAGPLARGTFGELMGLPQVAQHAQDVALAALAQCQATAAATPSRGNKPNLKVYYPDSFDRHMAAPLISGGPSSSR